MNWYLSKLIFSIESDASGKKAQFDEQLRLVQAPNEMDAYFKAKQIGKSLQSDFENEENQTVSWLFVDVSELIEIKEIKDGIEVYSTTHETYDKENFINSVLQKGIALQSKHLSFC